jgi:uncharacterized membrane protein (DUF4010 family)
LLEESLAVIGVLIAVSTNAMTKVFFAFSSGPRAFAIRVTTGQALVLASMWGAWLLENLLRANA